MWKRLWQAFWQTWTIDKPAALGDWLWQILVVDLAAFLDRLTLRRVIAFIPVVILILAYLHRIPLPPELMLLGDMLAYIDIFSMIFLIGIFTRVTIVMTVVRQAADHLLWILQRVPIALRMLDVRHLRAKGASRRKRRDRANTDDDIAVFPGMVCV
ncbi:hypothetical protein [Bradyrhizobium genosp. P]|uniref:hypothetical protein n=1 Tax=Bradyrhizobium genosp. P TaxID=83641 RepID=UPI003CE8F350